MNKEETLGQAKAMPLGKIINDKTFYIPLYQRNYKWNKKTAVKLAEDLIRCYLKGKQEKSIGLLTLFEHENKNGVYDIIDGQQRFITLAIILSLLDDNSNIEIVFERDTSNRIRENAIAGIDVRDTNTDVDRIVRNKKAIREAIFTYSNYNNSSKICENQKKEFKKFILESCVMLCSIVNDKPEKEFMNLNAYKTSFSICDYVRANLISLNSFYKSELMTRETELATILDKQSYKTAIAMLYNQLLDNLYYENEKGKQYSSIYDIMLDGIEEKESERKKYNPDKTKEARINILFYKNRTNESNYFTSEIIENYEYWYKMILKLACIKRMFNELRLEHESKYYQSFKQIEDFQKLKKTAFIDLIMEIDENETDYLEGKLSLAELLELKSNVENVLLPKLEVADQKLANRYLESFVYSGVNKSTVTKAEDGLEIVDLPKLSNMDMIDEIQGIGRYIIDRYLTEKERDNNSIINIAPIVDFEDRENWNFGGELQLNGNSIITIKELFSHSIKIPVIQRDYCMGARFEKEKSDDFIDYLIEGFSRKEKLNVSTILVAIEKSEKESPIYIFDGQQRTYTIYQTLKFLSETKNIPFNLNTYVFIGRKNNEGIDIEDGSTYAHTSVKNLKDILKIKLKNYDAKDLYDYILENVTFNIKITEKVSDAEQFFMDINGGVPLEKYEIFKSVLCEKLKKMEHGRDIINKIENDWLEFFYKWIKKEQKSNDVNFKKEENEDDEEEIIEMRCIEFLCRYIYNSRGNKEIVNIFDNVESKAKLISELSYINNMSPKDFFDVEKIMEDIIRELQYIDVRAERNKHSYIYEERKVFQLSSNNKISKVGVLLKIETDKRYMDDKAWIYNAFLWSLRDRNRIFLMKYYVWNDLNEIKGLYDNDELLKYTLSQFLISKQSEDIKFTYNNIDRLKCVGLYPGYNIDKKEWKSIPEKEIEAYYFYCFSNVSTEEDIIRIHYLYKLAQKEGNLGDNYKFVFTRKGSKQIKFSNKDFESFLILSRDPRFEEHYKEELLKMSTHNAYMINAVNSSIEACYLRNEI